MTNTQIEAVAVDPRRVARLARAARERAPLDAAEVLANEADEVVATVLGELHTTLAFKILLRLPEERRESMLPELNAKLEQRWEDNQNYPDESVGRLMEPVAAVFDTTTTVAEATARIRELVKQTVFTYAYVTDAGGILQGVVVMRDLLFAETDALLSDVMIERPFFFHPEMPVADAMHEVVYRHYPAYPVCDEAGRLLGVVQGYMLFEEQAFELSAQPGQMVGVDKEEHVFTSWPVSFRFRHPWLQVNLVTAFLAAAVVGFFEQTIAQVVVLAAFLPVLAGQSGNTGSQALAITLRGLTLGEFGEGVRGQVLRKEAWLGTLNGMLVGLVGAAGMFVYATVSGADAPLVLAMVVLLAMTGACVASGLAGVVVPLTLQRLGADPATASSILLTTATDVVSMGMFLWLASLLAL